MTFHVPNEARLRSGPLASDDDDGNNGAFRVTCTAGSFHAVLLIIASDGEGWEHVSVSLKTRTPRWEEMCYVKSLFWDDEDVVIQIHPRASEYVNNFSNCLHMWRPTNQSLPTPDQFLVGIKDLGTLK